MAQAEVGRGVGALGVAGDHPPAAVGHGGKAPVDVADDVEHEALIAPVGGIGPFGVAGEAAVMAVRHHDQERRDRALRDKRVQGHAGGAGGNERPRGARGAVEQIHDAVSPVSAGAVAGREIDVVVPGLAERRRVKREGLRCRREPPVDRAGPGSLGTGHSWRHRHRPRSCRPPATGPRRSRQTARGSSSVPSRSVAGRRRAGADRRRLAGPSAQGGRLRLRASRAGSAAARAVGGPRSPAVLRLTVAWLPVGALAAWVLGPPGRWRALALAVVAFALLAGIGAASDAASISGPLSEHVGSAGGAAWDAGRGRPHRAGRTGGVVAKTGRDAGSQRALSRGLRGARTYDSACRTRRPATGRSSEL